MENEHAAFAEPDNGILDRSEIVDRQVGRQVAGVVAAQETFHDPGGAIDELMIRSGAQKRILFGRIGDVAEYRGAATEEGKAAGGWRDRAGERARIVDDLAG